MSFLEKRFPTDISLGSRGGPRWRTIVTPNQAGWETRIQKWEDIKSEYDVGYGVRSIEDGQALVAFFNEVRGRAYAFRYKDWLDYSVTDEILNLDGTPTFQLQKVYGTGDNDYYRDIKKPVAGVTMKRNATSFTDFTLDTTTGIGTFSANLFSGVITAISQAANARITFSLAHGRSVGDYIYFQSVAGMTQINLLVGVVTNIVNTTQLDVDIDSTSFTAYTSGGTGRVYVEAGDVFSWTGEFDIPVRFNEDSLDVSLETGDLINSAVNLVEVRT